MENTLRFLDALERHDMDATAELLAPEVTWTLRMLTTGSQQPGMISGRERVLARLTELGSWFDRIAFADRRVSLVDGTATTFTTFTTFVQTNGDFQTVDGYAYRNVYVFRFDWRDEKMISWEEYANPVIIQKLERRHA